MDKGKSIPIIIKKNLNSDSPLEVSIGEKKTSKRVFHQEQVSLDKIVTDSSSSFYITGKTTKIGLPNFLQLITKHNVLEVENLDQEEVIVSSDFITRVATATVIDEDEDSIKYVDSVAIGIVIASLLLSIFALLTKTLEDIKTFSWIILLISTVFLISYTVKGVKSGELGKVWRVVIKSLSKH